MKHLTFPHKVIRFIYFLYVIWGIVTLITQPHWHLISQETLVTIVGLSLLGLFFHFIYVIGHTIYQDLVPKKIIPIGYYKVDRLPGDFEILHQKIFHENYTVYTYNDNYNQAVITPINYRSMEYNWQFERSNNERQNSNPRNWPKNKWVYGSQFRTPSNPKGKIWLYERTHLAPFRFTRTEDNIVTISGSTELNTGKIPLRNYNPGDLNRYQKSVLSLIYKAHGRSIKYPYRLGGIYGSALSLEDFERAATTIIKQNKYDQFVYYSLAYYQNNWPKTVRVRFYNLSKNKLVFDVFLNNPKH